VTVADTVVVAVTTRKYTPRWKLPAVPGV